MVTKPTGRPRGRPRKPNVEKPARQRGRPDKPLLADPERYLIAFFEAQARILKSERKGAMFLAAMTVGNEVSIPSDVAAKCPEGYVPLAWGQARPKDYGPITNTKSGSGAGTIKGRADAIRKKARQSWGNDAATDQWLFNMAAAFGVSISPIIDEQQAKDLVLGLTTQVGETEFAKCVIMPMIDIAVGRATMAPDFSLIYGPTTSG